ncbi:MAG: hypothetical protein FIA89_05395 [Geobacter sp.]|nr:hypothetical protein [Geobacter sp.]
MWNGSGELSCNHWRYKNWLLVRGKCLMRMVRTTAVIFAVAATALMMVIVMTCVCGMMPCQDDTGSTLSTSRRSMPGMERAGKQADKQQYGGNSQHQGIISLAFLLLNDDRLASCCKDEMIKV